MTPKTPVGVGSTVCFRLGRRSWHMVRLSHALGSTARRGWTPRYSLPPATEIKSSPGLGRGTLAGATSRRSHSAPRAVAIDCEVAETDRTASPLTEEYRMRFEPSRDVLDRSHRRKGFG
jgi:hypothetical protein